MKTRVDWRCSPSLKGTDEGRGGVAQVVWSELSIYHQKWKINDGDRDWFQMTRGEMNKYLIAEIPLLAMLMHKRLCDYTPGSACPVFALMLPTVRGSRR